MTTEPIAAWLAANTPIGTRYALVSIPGTELSDGAQGVTQSPFDLAFELSERELGATIGFPALVYDAQQDAPAPFYGARGEPSTLRRAINDAINMYIAYECETDVGSEQSLELAVGYMV